MVQVDVPTSNPVVLTDQKTPHISYTTIEVKSIDDSFTPYDAIQVSSEELNSTLTKSSANGLGGLVLPSGDEQTSETATKILEVKKASELILSIIFEYALNKFDDSEDRHAAGAPKFLTVIERFVSAQERVEMCLPAFPFKSANKVHKVLGVLPDKAEELALDRLNSMCMRIREAYVPGAKVTIISDGITYNDLLSISDRDTWAYGEALRDMATNKGFEHIGFSRMKDLLELDLPEKLREITYVANCTNFRRLLLNKYEKPDLNIDQEIATNPDTRLTYLGYRRFLESDLRHIFTLGDKRTSNGYKRDVKYLAKQMLIRGYAFAEAIKHAFPNHLRLSIHQSIGEHKISMSLLNTKTGFTTPWHCSVALLADGEWVSAPMGDFKNDSRLELLHENGRPSYFIERSLGSDVPSISETSASYLQAPKRLSGYFSGSSSPSTSSTGSENSTPNGSFLSPNVNGDEITLTRPNGVVPNDNAPPAYGRRLIPQIMDTLASTDPNRIVFSLTTYSGGDLTFRHISARSFVMAVNKTAWWLHNHVGRPESIQPVGYIGPHDLRHILLTYACVKAGYSALFLSPKNSIEGAVAVLKSVDCKIWVRPHEAASVPLVGEILQQWPLKVLDLPELDELLDAETTQPFPYNKSFEEAKSDPFCFLHTSGTTGVPKPIPWSHELIGTMDAVRLLPPTEGDHGLLPWTNNWNEGDRIYSSFPMSHGAGIIMDILMPALFNLHCVLGPVGILPNMNLIEKLAEQGNIDIWSMVPSLVDELGETPDVLAKFKPSKFICASGGPVSQISAGKVNEIIRVLNLTGTTEGLFIGNLWVPREDWFWFAFHPYSGFEFKEVEADTFEHWVHRNEHSSLFQGIFCTFPDKDSVNFKDLYMRHPTKPYMWAFKGRSDDLIVLSNGYKISPLETEAFVATHPAINGCLVIGSGRPQAGLLIELKDPSSKTDELMDSIWATVEKANSLSRHKNQLLRDFVTFAEMDKPFIRTDKGTIKRPATLALYADFIERFYSSRDDDVVYIAMDMTSIQTIQESVREVLSSSLSAIQDADIDEDFFGLGLDSLGVFAAVKTIRAAMGLQEQLAPRHLYANPTLETFSAVLWRLAVEANSSNSSVATEPIDDESARLKRIIAEHKARQSFKLNALDYVNPNHYMGLVFYFPLHQGAKFEDVFENLQEGLNRTLKLIPALGGKMMNCSDQEIGYKEGDLCVTIAPASLASSVNNRLIFKDLSQVLPSFKTLRDAGFVPSAFKDDLVLPDDPFPAMPADILVAQANFIEGGCILAANLNHCCLDAVGVMVAIRAWAENCRFLQGDESAVCEWYDPESFNHSLPEIIHEQENHVKSVEEVDPGTWAFLPFFRPDNFPGPARPGGLPAPPVFPLHSVWPLPAAEKPLSTTLFLISPEKVESLKQEVLADPEAKGVITSVSDMLQALFWRSAIRARYRVAAELEGKIFNSEEISILESPTDGRPYFSSLLPATYMGSMLIMNRSSMPIETLCSPETSVGRIAYLLRESATRITPSLVHDAFTLLQALPDHRRFSTANMGLAHMHAMISNMILFRPDEINFGHRFFANGGSPETMRPQLERGNGRFRFLVIFPMKKDGGVELALGTSLEELEMFKTDAEFMKYAELVDRC